MPSEYDVDNVSGNPSRTDGIPVPMAASEQGVHPDGNAGKAGNPAESGQVPASTPAEILHLTSDRTLRQQHPLTYQSWRAMRDRCRKGKFVLDERWERFECFFADMGPRPARDFTIDRIDPADRTYGPDRCRWVGKKAQTRNRRNTIFLTDEDNTVRSLGEWADFVGQKPDTLYRRRRKGWPDHEVIHGRKATGAAARVEDPVAALPYPVDTKGKKLWWERQFRKEGRDGETRLEFFVRQGNLFYGPMRYDLLRERPADPELRKLWFTDPDVQARVAELRKIERWVLEAMHQLEMMRLRNLAAEHVRSMRGRPDFLGKGAEVAIFAKLHGVEPAELGDVPGGGRRPRRREVDPDSWDEGDDGFDTPEYGDY